MSDVPFAAFVDDPAEVRRLEDALTAEQARLARDLADVGPTDGLDAALARQVAANLAAKRDATPAFALDADRIARQVVAYEAFKLETYVRTGVFPKRYFGFVDGERDTADAERAFLATVVASRQACNDWLAAQGEPWRVTDAEIAVTWLAEGGALWMSDRTDRLGSFHPVFDIGLDDLASGDRDLPGLRDAIDARAGTGLGSLVAWLDRGETVLPVPTVVPESHRWLIWPGRQPDPPRYPYLVRYMTTEEAVAGTALMWVWEKQIAARALASKGLPSMASRSADEQFVIGSLVYNSGKPHTQERWTQITSFRASSWIAGAARTKGRPELPVSASAEALAGLIAGGDYPAQGTSWLAGYHVLQRYGGYVALARFTDAFDADGALRPLAEAPAPAPVVAPPVPPVTASEPSCATSWSAPASALAGIAAACARRRRRPA